MIYSLDNLRTYTRSLDNRLEDVVKYPNSWIDDRIDEGIATAQEIRPIFSTKETYNVENDFVTLGLTEVEIIPQLEVYAIYDVICDKDYFDTIEITRNNHIIISHTSTFKEPKDYLIDIRYFYYPLTPYDELEMSMEMSRLVKEGIAVNTFHWLKDKENKMYHRQELEEMKLLGTFDTEKDLLALDPEKFWNNTWN